MNRLKHRYSTLHQVQSKNMQVVKNRHQKTKTKTWQNECPHEDMLSDGTLFHKISTKKKERHTSKANLLPKDTSIKVGNIARIAPKWPQRIQGQCDGHRDVDQTRVLQQGWRLGAGSRLATGHCALWCNGLIQAVLEGLVFWDAKVNLVESEKKGVPILVGKKKKTDTTVTKVNSK